MTDPIGAVRNNDWLDAAIAAAAAQGGQYGAHALTTLQRALEGFNQASGKVPAGANPTTAAVYDAGANARSILGRTDLPPEMRAQVANIIEHLGTGLANGTIEPSINNVFRQHLYDLATEPHSSSKFKGALAQMSRASEVLS